ncbi:hypothetical protein DFH11DRAFT_1726955 [Phellopilus nigrolimitatus]|nr:hypothetical protein DFH11DRAFT_1726955 [Phellopilus nigrolimitatus]
MTSKSASPTIQSPPSFFQEELKRALDEQSFGIVEYSLFGQTSAYEANASVELLERVRVYVTLSIRGFQVTGTSARSHCAASTAADENAMFETVDALLQHCSPLYSARRTEELFAKLMF